jgi:hypothetical protein
LPFPDSRPPADDGPAVFTSPGVALRLERFDELPLRLACAAKDLPRAATFASPLAAGSLMAADLIMNPF